MKANNEILKVTNIVDESTAERENLEKMMEINNLLVGPLTENLKLIQPHRKYVFEGACIHENEEYHLFLFNDSIFWTYKLGSFHLLSRITPLSDNIQSVNKHTVSKSFFPNYRGILSTPTEVNKKKIVDDHESLVLKIACADSNDLFFEFASPLLCSKWLHFISGCWQKNIIKKNENNGFVNFPGIDNKRKSNLFLDRELKEQIRRKIEKKKETPVIRKDKLSSSKTKLPKTRKNQQEKFNFYLNLDSVEDKRDSNNVCLSAKIYKGNKKHNSLSNLFCCLFFFLFFFIFLYFSLFLFLFFIFFFFFRKRPELFQH